MSAPIASHNSAFYIGKVFHKRYLPKIHQFTYPLYMTWLDLNEIPYLEETYRWFSTKHFAPIQLKVSDYFSNLTGEQCEIVNRISENQGALPCEIALKQKIIALASSLGANTDHIQSIKMLAHMRSLGVYFSPVNFYYLYEGSSHARYMLAEVSNTPWNKSHCYLVDMAAQVPTPKDFHVSPFMTLEMEYRWDIHEPGEEVSINIENWREERLFQAAFSAKRFSMDEAFWRVWLRWPMVGFSVVRGIYWHALKLLLKGIKFIPYQHRKKV